MHITLSRHVLKFIYGSATLAEVFSPGLRAHALVPLYARRVTKLSPRPCAVIGGGAIQFWSTLQRKIRGTCEAARNVKKRLVGAATSRLLSEL
ncbi:hypothetical protein DPEC_G00084100 [Dallia pectoralis]|uniref:Uncharacterized protein n=1 Tax=Dallia pectoralis TaxID=75939 RepID=A0ACC2GYZ6_DALPE|nr:hypothetical protein DPEC_G00084100 [Dallia pectoralis]